jgi:hypothetical protein
MGIDEEWSGDGLAIGEPNDKHDDTDYRDDARLPPRATEPKVDGEQPGDAGGRAAKEIDLHCGIRHFANDEDSGESHTRQCGQQADDR